MPAATAQSWGAMGEGSLTDVEQLFESGAWRSCVSRAYYSGMAFAHAILLHLRRTPPDLGNWPNPHLPTVLFAALDSLSTRDREWKAVAKSLRSELNTCWTARLLADYSPLAPITRSTAVEARKGARRIGFVWRTMYDR